MADMNIRYVTVKFLGEEYFKRISEYFTDVENSSGRAIVRTDPIVRSGNYFVFDASRSPRHLPTGSKVIVDYVLGEDPQRCSQTFELSQANPLASEYFLGFTTPEWQTSKINSIRAWQIRVVGPDGAVLAQDKSFLF